MIHRLSSQVCVSSLYRPLPALPITQRCLIDESHTDTSYTRYTTPPSSGRNDDRTRGRLPPSPPRQGKQTTSTHRFAGQLDGFDYLDWGSFSRFASLPIPSGIVNGSICQSHGRPRQLRSLRRARSLATTYCFGQSEWTTVSA
jgi:hypothetical protein